MRVEKQTIVQGKSTAPDIRRRTYLFGARILKMVRRLPRDVGSQIVARQVARSGTSIGGNIEEAQEALSPADFARRMNIALGEARETHYWLRLLGEAGIATKGQLREVVGEADEIIRILTTIVKKIRSKTLASRNPSVVKRSPSIAQRKAVSQLSTHNSQLLEEHL